MTVQMKRCPKCNKMQMAGRLHTCAVTLRDRKDDARTADEPRKQDLVQPAADEPLNTLAVAIALDMVTQPDSTLDQVADSMTPPAPAFEGGGGGYGGAGASGSWDSGTSGDSGTTTDSGGGGYDGGSSDSSGGGGGD